MTRFIIDFPLNDITPQRHSQQFYTTYAYDEAGRLLSIDYPNNFTPNNERVTYRYNGMGLVESIDSNLYADPIVDKIGYNEVGNVTSMHYAVEDLYLTKSYHPWKSGTSSDSNARLESIRVGTSSVLSAKLRLRYNNDSFGNIWYIGEKYNSGSEVARTFDYDAQNRLHHSYDSGGAVEKLYETQGDGRPSSYEGQFDFYQPDHPYAVYAATVGSRTLHYDRDLNGNAITREYMDGGVEKVQTLTWNNANRLSAISGSTAESYWYDAEGIRTRKRDNTAISTFYPYAFYETYNSVATRYYLLNGQPIAYREGAGDLTYLHHDQVGSVVMTTSGGNIVQKRQYFPYGNKRGGDELAKEPNYTGQRKDDSGLIYYNARYYDPALGQFISPDTIIPDPTDYFSYNRYLYGRGNPIRNNDPSGHCATNEDGSPDTAGDGGCWEAANEFYATFGGGGYESRDQWTQYFASNSSITEEILRMPLDAYWTPWYGERGLFHARYNPPPVWNEPPPHPIEAVDAMAEAAGHAVGGYVSDITSIDCSVRDCVAIALDTAGVAGAGLALASPTCTVAGLGCVVVGQGIATGAGVGGTLWTLYNRMYTDGASNADALVVTSGAIIGLAGPQAGLGAAVFQVIWDVFISPYDEYK